MYFEEELTVAILSKNEAMLGMLHPNYVSISENNQSKGLRTIDITHPLTDDNNNDLTRYNSLLNHGNKVWRQKTGDGNSCLYVLLEDKEIDPLANTVSITAEEVATELSMLPPVRLNMSAAATIDSTWLTTYFGGQFTMGTIASGKTFSYSGVIGIMDLLREIENQTGCEFAFRYAYDTSSKVIHRYLDFKTQIGKTIADPVRIGYNTDNIQYDDTEADVAIAAAPTGAPSGTADTANDDFHQARKAWEDLAISEGQQIPSVVTKDDSGNPLNGPNKAAPFAKVAGQSYVKCDPSDSGALYTQVYQKEKSTTNAPRTVLFNTSETDPYNIYWLCVTNILAKMQPSVKLVANVVDIKKIEGYTPSYFNVGDIISVQLPGRYDKVTARVIKTTKNPRTPESDKIEIGNYVIDFFADYLNNPYPRSQPFQATYPGTAPDGTFIHK